MPDSIPPQDHPQSSLEQELEEAHVRRAKATARLSEAKATKAEYQAEQIGHWAAAEPERQKMTLRERGKHLRLEETKVQMLMLVILVAIGIQIAGVIVNPLFFSLNLFIACIGLLAKRQGRKLFDPAPKERDPDP